MQQIRHENPLSKKPIVSRARLQLSNVNWKKLTKWFVTVILKFDVFF